MPELVGGNREERFVAKRKPEHQPARHRAQNHRAEHPRVEISDDFLSENRIAAIGVLKAAAIAAAVPTGISCRRCSVSSPRASPTEEAIPAPICADGPSRPRRDAGPG